MEGQRMIQVKGTSVPGFALAIGKAGNTSFTICGLRTKSSQSGPLDHGPVELISDRAIKDGVTD